MCVCVCACVCVWEIFMQAGRWENDAEAFLTPLLLPLFPSQCILVFFPFFGCTALISHFPAAVSVSCHIRSHYWEVCVGEAPFRAAPCTRENYTVPYLCLLRTHTHCMCCCEVNEVLLNLSYLLLLWLTGTEKNAYFITLKLIIIIIIIIINNFKERNIMKRKKLFYQIW